MMPRSGGGYKRGSGWVYPCRTGDGVGCLRVYTRGMDAFHAFWDGCRRTRLAQASVFRHGVPRLQDGLLVSTVHWIQSHGVEVGGWLCRPVSGEPVMGLVISHGYGGRGAIDAARVPPGTIAFFPCMPGFDLSRSDRIPGVAAQHVLHGIADRATYVLLDCVEATWRSFDLLAELCPGLPLVYEGESFGGGIGALALPGESRCAGGVLVVPTFGNHPARLLTPCCGSGEAVRQYHATHPEVVEMLQWYDAATAAAGIACPVLVCAADADPAVPAVGQWSVANAIRRGGVIRLSHGHATPPDEYRVVQDAWKRFLLGIAAAHPSGRIGGAQVPAKR